MPRITFSRIAFQSEPLLGYRNARFALSTTTTKESEQMKNDLRLCLLVLSLSAAAVLRASHPAQASTSPRAPATFKAGLAKIAITPERPVWMAGYAARTKPSEGKIQDLHAKALAITDAKGNRVVIVTTDLLGLPRALTAEVSEYANKSYGLRRAQILFNSS